jgi:hypothetical protein
MQDYVSNILNFYYQDVTGNASAASHYIYFSVLQARIVIPPIHEGEPPLLSLKVQLQPVQNLTLEQLKAAGSGKRRLLQSQLENPCLQGTFEGRVYVPAIGKQLSIHGEVLARLMTNSAGAEALVGQATVNSYWGVDYEIQTASTPQSEGNFSTAVKIGNASCQVTGVTHFAQMWQWQSFSSYHTAWLHCPKPAVAAIFNAFLQLNTTSVPVYRGWYSAQVENGSVTVVGAYKAEILTQISSYYGQGWLGAWLLSSNSSGSIQATVPAGHMYGQVPPGSWNGTLVFQPNFYGQVEGVVSIGADQIIRCSACSRCITSMASAMQKALVEANSTTVASLFATACTASKRNVTLCNQVQNAIAASSQGNLGKCKGPSTWH